MKKKRVAAYARVSTKSRTQAHSYDFQSRYWNEQLGKSDKYDYVGLFADNGISGKFAERRPQFMALIEACRNGTIDIVFTKSVQRFARNTEELLKLVRELREIGVAVIFEKENINTLKPDSELFLTIAAAVAEDDLRRYSGNVLWTLRDKFQRSEYKIGNRLYGYIITKERKLIVNNEEAKIVKTIFEKLAIEEWSSFKIATWLNDKGIIAPLGGKWNDTQIRLMIRNEKYYGDVIMQKQYTENGVRKVNRGERDAFLLENNHEPIVSKELWNKAQAVLLARRNEKLVGRRNKIYPFTGLIVCEKCGAHLTHKVNNSGTPCQSNYWKCHNSIVNGTKACSNPGIKESIINDLFVECYNEFVTKGYMNKSVEEKTIDEKLQHLYALDDELAMVRVKGIINKFQYEKERESILAEIRDLQLKLQELRYFKVGDDDFKTINKFDEIKLQRFIKRVTILDWMVTFEFYNGVKLSRKYTNGKHGDIRDWQRKQKLRREQGNV